MKHQPTSHVRMSAYLLSAALLGACGSKLTEPVKTTVPLHTPASARLGMPAGYSSQTYGVPEASRVEFSLSAATQVHDLTY